MPKGESRAIAPDEQISLLDPTARGRLQVGELEFVLFKMAEIRLVKWEGDDIGTWLEHGHLRVTLAEDATSRLRLETSTNVVLTPLTADTEFTVCQTPPDVPKPVTCLRVIKGEVEWVSSGAAKTYRAGDTTFAFGGEPPQGVRCLSAAAYEQWFQDALSEEPPANLPDLGGLVNDAPDCPAVGADESTSSTAATSSTTATTTTTSAPAGTAATTGQRPPAPPPATPPPATPPRRHRRRCLPPRHRRRPQSHRRRRQSQRRRPQSQRRRPLIHRRRRSRRRLISHRAGRYGPFGHCGQVWWYGSSGRSRDHSSWVRFRPAPRQPRSTSASSGIHTRAVPSSLPLAKCAPSGL